MVKKVIIFDLDETIGYFQQISILDHYFKNTFEIQKEFALVEYLLNTFPQVFRPGIFKIFKNIKKQKKSNGNIVVVLYTNNNSTGLWVNHIIDYIHNKLQYKLFDHIIKAHKIGNKIVEPKRISNEKSLIDVMRCTKLSPKNLFCFIDDQYHNRMNNKNIYYLHTFPYIKTITPNEVINKFKSNMILNHLLGKQILIFIRDLERFIRGNLEQRIISNDRENIKITETLNKHIQYFLTK